MRDERDPTDKQRGGLLEQGAESGDESGDERGEQAVNAEELGNRRGRQVRDRRDDREAAERPKLHRQDTGLCSQRNRERLTHEARTAKSRVDV